MTTKIILTLSATLLIAFDFKQTANAQTEKAGNAQQICSHNDTGTRRGLDSLINANGVTSDTLADGTIVIELTPNTQIARLPRYYPGQTYYASKDRYRSRIFLLGIIIIGILICLPIMYFTTIRTSKKARKNYLKNLRIFKADLEYSPFLGSQECDKAMTILLVLWNTQIPNTA